MHAQLICYNTEVILGRKWRPVIEKKNTNAKFFLVKSVKHFVSIPTRQKVKISQC